MDTDGKKGELFSGNPAGSRRLLIDEDKQGCIITPVLVVELRCQAAALISQTNMCKCAAAQP